MMTIRSCPARNSHPISRRSEPSRLKLLMMTGTWRCASIRSGGRSGPGAFVAGLRRASEKRAPSLFIGTRLPCFLSLNFSLAYRMAIKLNHTIVHSQNPETAASFFAGLFGLPAPKPFGPFLDVELGNEVTLAFLDAEGMDVQMQH